MKLYKSKFGELVKAKRYIIKLTLREACKQTGVDPSNWSKIERGIMAPPPDLNIIKKMGRALGIDDPGKEMNEFICLSQITRGEIPTEILESKDLLPLLPAFFRTLKGKKPTEEEILKVLDLLNNH